MTLEDILPVCTVLSTVASLVQALVAWDKRLHENRYRQEKRYRQTPEWNGYSDLDRLADIERRRKLWWGFGAGIAAAVAVGAFLGWRLNQPGPRGWTVGILATQDWTDTGVDCKAGDILEITAAGTIYHNRTMSDGVGPDGDPNRDLRKFNVHELRNSNHAGLIGRIDRRRPYFIVGKKRTYECPAEGGLFLGINDAGLDNNRGKFEATIKERTIAG